MLERFSSYVNVLVEEGFTTEIAIGITCSFYGFVFLFCAIILVLLIVAISFLCCFPFLHYYLVIYTKTDNDLKCSFKCVDGFKIGLRSFCKRLTNEGYLIDKVLLFNNSIDRKCFLDTSYLVFTDYKTIYDFTMDKSL